MLNSLLNKKASVGPFVALQRSGPFRGSVVVDFCKGPESVTGGMVAKGANLPPDVLVSATALSHFGGPPLDGTSSSTFPIRPNLRPEFGQISAMSTECLSPDASGTNSRPGSTKFGRGRPVLTDEFGQTWPRIDQTYGADGPGGPICLQRCRGSGAAPAEAAPLGAAESAAAGRTGAGPRLGLTRAVCRGLGTCRERRALRTSGLSGLRPRTAREPPENKANPPEPPKTNNDIVMPRAKMQRTPTLDNPRPKRPPERANDTDPLHARHETKRSRSPTTQRVCGHALRTPELTLSGGDGNFGETKTKTCFCVSSEAFVSPSACRRRTGKDARCLRHERFTIKARRAGNLHGSSRIERPHAWACTCPWRMMSARSSASHCKLKALPASHVNVGVTIG